MYSKRHASYFTKYIMIDFNELPSSAKVYIYPSNKKFHPNLKKDIVSNLVNAIDTLSIEYPNYSISYKIFYNRFIVFGVDYKEYTPTISFIDKITSFILILQETFSLLLIDKMNVSFKQGEYVQYIDLIKFKSLVKNKSISSSTIVFDHTVITKFDFDNFWEVTLNNSWLNRYL